MFKTHLAERLERKFGRKQMDFDRSGRVDWQENRRTSRNYCKRCVWRHY
jgi:hypothetical protein